MPAPQLAPGNYKLFPPSATPAQLSSIGSPPRRSLLATIEFLMVSCPPVLFINADAPSAALLSKMVLLVMVRVPALLKMAPPPLLAKLPEIVVLPMLSAPCSMAIAPPLLPAVLIASKVRIRLIVPLLLKIAAPSSAARLDAMVLSVTDTVPPSFRMAAPLPPLPLLTAGLAAPSPILMRFRVSEAPALTWKMRVRNLPPIETSPPPSMDTTAVTVISFVIVMITGFGPQLKVMAPPPDNAATRAASLQLSGVPVPTEPAALTHSPEPKILASTMTSTAPHANLINVETCIRTATPPLPLFYDGLIIVEL